MLHLSRITRLVLLSMCCTLTTMALGRVIRPIKESDQSVGLVFVQGMMVDVEAYAALAREIQNQSSQAVWVALVNFPMKIPNPLLYFKVTDQAIKELKAAGMPGDNIYIAGHSLGGTILQAQDANLHGGMEDGDPGVNRPRLQGMILLGSYVTRKNQFVLSQLPILTLGGELDGMTRIGRIAEAYARQIESATDRQAAAIKSPVVVLPGVNHHQYFTGAAPLIVRKRDLLSTRKDEDARREIARVVALFIEAQADPSADAGTQLQDYVNATGALVRPLIEAMEWEGSYHLKTPCTSTKGEVIDQSHCRAGSPWAERAQQIMAGEIPGVTLKVTNVFHESWRMYPFFHAHILNNCIQGENCVIHIDNSAQNVYSRQDRMDTAFSPVAASQMRVKLKSRQSILQAAGYDKPDFKTTDEWDVCAAINQQAFDWAQEHAPTATLARYQAQGIPLVMGADIAESGGPTFIWSPVQMRTIKRQDGSKAVEIRVQTMRAPMQGAAAHAAGAHYCKLVSPAWFMDWIYTDGLRR